MSRLPGSYGLAAVRGATWEEEFVYADESGQPIDLTGYEARMQVRALEGQYGLTEATTLVMELTTENGLLMWDTADEGRLRITVSAKDSVALNPDNLKKTRHCYSLELYRPAGVDPDTEPEYVIPLVQGKVSVLGETTR